MREGGLFLFKMPISAPPSLTYVHAIDSNYSLIKEHEATEKLCLELESIKSGAMFTACLPERM